MKIDELIQKLQEVRHEHGNLTVCYDDNDFYPSEVKHVGYEEESRPDPLNADYLQKEHVLLI